MIRDLVALVERLNLSTPQNMVGNHFPEILALLSIVFGGSFLLFAWKHHGKDLEADHGRSIRPGNRVRGEERSAHLAADDAAHGAHHSVHAGRHAGLRRPNGLGDQCGHRGEGEADADAEHRHRRQDLPRVVVPRGE